MALSIPYDMVRMTVASVASAGVGAITLGSAVDGYASFDNAGVPNGATVTIRIREGTNWEIVQGVYTASGTQVSRDAVRLAKSGSTFNTTKQAFTSAAVVDIIDCATDLIRATPADVYASTERRLLTAGILQTAAAFVTLTETSGAVAVDWGSFVNGEVTVDQATVISNPTGEVPGQQRYIVVKGNDTTDRAITFGNQFLGDLPTITDCDSTKWYGLLIDCIATDHFTVQSHVVKKP